MAEKPKGKGWKLYRCTNASHAPYLKEGAEYWLRKVRNGWLEDAGMSRFAQFRFAEISTNE